MGIVVTAPPASPLGATIPSATPHAVSVSLPTWQDNVDYEEGHPRVTAAMTSGYPRFYIHHQIDQLAQLTATQYGQPGESAMLFPSEANAADCRAFLQAQSPAVPARIIHYTIQSSTPATATTHEDDSPIERTIILHATLFPTDSFSIAKQFWQHTGDGISSRLAERCLILLGAIANNDEAESSTSRSRSGSIGGRGQAKNRHYAPPIRASSIPEISTKSKGRYGTARSVLPSALESTTSDLATTSLDPIASSSSLKMTTTAEPDPLEDDEFLARYVEERYGRNLDLSLAPIAKLAMRRRIAGVLRESSGTNSPVIPSPSPTPTPQHANGTNDEANGEKKRNGVLARGRQASTFEESSRGVEGLTEADVWLYPCGMSAIYHAHQLVRGVRKYEGGKEGKSVCFGFPYTDTLKILQKWGEGVHFLGHGLASDLPALRSLCLSASPPILALFCEFPSNPLLRTPPLRELRKLADEFGFMIVIDETIAGFVNVEVLPLADVVVSSLTKVFSGDSNVMGGSLVISPSSPHYAALKAVQAFVYEDTYFDEDAIYMERNSRDFQDRIARENYNAEMLCEVLRTRRAEGPYPVGILPVSTLLTSSSTATTNGNGSKKRKCVIKEIYYPKYMTPENYIDCMRPPSIVPTVASPGYGGLFSLTFTSLLASAKFFDALKCYKGPSLGTNFTLACPYTILAHYYETDWAREWGVESGLVRVSTGLEDPALLLEWFEEALEAAEKACEEAESAVE